MNDSVAKCLDAFSRSPLLTRDEEIILGRDVQRRQRLIEAFPDVATDASVASAAMAANNLTSLQLRRILRTGQRAKDRMVKANLRLVVSIATKYNFNTGTLELTDLIQEGTFGLIRAIELFDPERGYKLSTLSYWHIRQKITKAISQQSTTIRIPLHTRKRMVDIKKLQSSASAEGRDLSVEKAAEQLGIDLTLIRHALRTRTVSLNAIIGHDTNTELEALLWVEPESPSLLSPHQIAYVQECIDLLPDNQKEVVNSSFMLKPGEQIQKATMSQSSRSRLRMNAYATLRHQLRYMKQEL
jgi:RNA polymerase nonessential primary-like sigma factor